MARGKYQGIIGGFIALGSAIGPVAGGALAQKVSWRVRSYSLSYTITGWYLNLTWSSSSGPSGLAFPFQHVHCRSWSFFFLWNQYPMISGGEKKKTYNWSLHVATHPAIPRYRKLLAIDFLGSILALLSCALLILPLIWVLFHSSFIVQTSVFTNYREASPFRGLHLSSWHLFAPALS